MSERLCSECDKPVRDYFTGNFRHTDNKVCSLICGRKRKTRLQRERRNSMKQAHVLASPKKSRMRVLIGCECSGVIRDAFLSKGHDAWSCDLKPSEQPGPHITGDVLKIINDGWDLFIAHPPCQYLSYAGSGFWNAPRRLARRIEALEFFKKLWNAPIRMICLENPRGCANPTIAKFSQEIQPFYFGDPHLKTTWLWLKGLPLLKWEAGQIIKPKPTMIDISGKNRYFTDSNTRRPEDRARTFQGIAKAMADQWG
jgi:hypothetical protein